MKKRITILIVLCSMFFYPLLRGQELQSSVLKINVAGYTHNSISVAFMQSPEWNMTFPHNPDNPRGIDYTFEVADIEGVYVNGQLVYIEPANELAITMRYDGRRLDQMEIASQNSPQTALANNLLQQIRQLRRQNRFKTQNLAWAMLNTPQKEHFEQSEKQLQAEKNLLETHKSNLSAAAYHYLLAESESIICTNIITYPFHAGTTADMMPEYASFLDNYTVATDAASLRNREYLSFLIAFYHYNSYLKEGKTTPAQSTQEVFNGLAGFYDGNVRDAVLFAFLHRALSDNSADFAAIEMLVNEYAAKYNTNKAYRNELNQMMQ